MRSALYYPHTEVRTEALWKSALLVWDELHIIVPYPEYRPQYSDKRFAEAFELIGIAHWPGEEEKRKAHEIIEDFATRPLPQSFSYKFCSDSNATPYELYPQEFFPEPMICFERPAAPAQSLPIPTIPLLNPQD